MSAVDKERIAAVRTLEHLGFKFDGEHWLGGVPPSCRKPTPCTGC